jgi:hypothetical protein
MSMAVVATEAEAGIIGSGQANGPAGDLNAGGLGLAARSPAQSSAAESFGAHFQTLIDSSTTLSGASGREPAWRKANSSTSSIPVRSAETQTDTSSASSPQMRANTAVNAQIITKEEEKSFTPAAGLSADAQGTASAKVLLEQAASWNAASPPYTLSAAGNAGTTSKEASDGLPLAEVLLSEEVPSSRASSRVASSAAAEPSKPSIQALSEDARPTSSAVRRSGAREKKSESSSQAELTATTVSATPFPVQQSPSAEWPLSNSVQLAAKTAAPAIAEGSATSVDSEASGVASTAGSLVEVHPTSRAAFIPASGGNTLAHEQPQSGPICSGPPERTESAPAFREASAARDRGAEFMPTSAEDAPIRGSSAEEDGVAQEVREISTCSSDPRQAGFIPTFEGNAPERAARGTPISSSSSEETDSAAARKTNDREDRLELGRVGSTPRSGGNATAHDPQAPPISSGSSTERTESVPEAREASTIRGRSEFAVQPKSEGETLLAAAATDPTRQQSAEAETAAGGARAQSTEAFERQRTVQNNPGITEAAPLPVSPATASGTVAGRAVKNSRNTAVETVPQRAGGTVSAPAVTNSVEAATLARVPAGERGVAGIRDSGVASSTAGTPAVSTEHAFSAMDAGTGVGNPSWVHAGARHAEAGFQDPALGWIGVRAEMGSGGNHVSLVPASGEAEQVLGGHIAGLNHHLTEERSPVETVTLASLGTGGAGAGAGHGGAQQQSGGSAGQWTGEEGQSASSSTLSPPAAQDVAYLSTGPTAFSGSATSSGKHISVMA